MPHFEWSAATVWAILKVSVSKCAKGAGRGEQLPLFAYTQRWQVWGLGGDRSMWYDPRCSGHPLKRLATPLGNEQSLRLPWSPQWRLQTAPRCAFPISELGSGRYLESEVEELRVVEEPGQKGLR